MLLGQLSRGSESHGGPRREVGHVPSWHLENRTRISRGMCLLSWHLWSLPTQSLLLTTVP